MLCIAWIQLDILFTGRNPVNIANPGSYNFYKFVPTEAEGSPSTRR